MTNVFDYLKWRGDLTLDKPNEIDALIFARLSYLPLENIILNNEKITISELYKRSLNIKNIPYLRKEDRQLFEVLAASSRYKGLYISNVVNKYDIDRVEQFLALTIHLPNNSVFTSFRGTTTEIFALKESIDMSYKIVKSQIDALNYVNSFSSYDKIYLGGHSKGGNLAVYALTNTTEDIASKIIKVYNFDGPGFLELDDNYHKIKNKVTTYLPTDSIIGRLLISDCKTIIVKCSSNSIHQHNIYNWQIEKDKFIPSRLSKESNIINEIINEFLSRVSLPERSKIINSLYQIIASSGVTKLSDLNINDLKRIILSYQNMDDKTKKLLFTIIKYLFDSANIGIKENIEDRVSKFSFLDYPNIISSDKKE